MIILMLQNPPAIFDAVMGCALILAVCFFGWRLLQAIGDLGTKAVEITIVLTFVFCCIALMYITVMFI